MKCENKNRLYPFPSQMSQEETKPGFSFLCLFYVVVHYFSLVNACFCCVRLCFIFSIPCQEIGLGNVSKMTYFVSSGT